MKKVKLSLEIEIETEVEVSIEDVVTDVTYVLQHSFGAEVKLKEIGTASDNALLHKIDQLYDAAFKGAAPSYMELEGKIYKKGN